MQFRALKTALALALAAASPLAAAYEEGQWLTRFGYATVAPDSSSSSGLLGDVVDVDDASSLGFSVTYMVTPAIGIEVLGALPFSHDIKGTGMLAGVDIGETKQLPPTVSLQWYPKMEGKLQPYLGVGLNYTIFLDQEASPELTAAAATLVPGTTSTRLLDLDDSFGLALQAGVDYALNDKWLLNAAVWHIDIETSTGVVLDNFPPIMVDEIVIDPWVYMIGAGYRF